MCIRDRFKTCISSPVACYLNIKPFKDISKFKYFFIKTVSGLYGRPARSTGFISGQISRPSGRLGLMVVCVHVCARLPVDRASRPTDPAVDRPVARLQDPNSQVLPVDRPGQPTVQFFVSILAGSRLEPTALLPCGLPVDRPVDRQLSRKPQRL